MYDDQVSEPARREPIIGLVLGIVLGISIVTGYVWQALLVVMFGVVGLSAGVAIMWIRRNPDNLINAWKTLKNG